MNDGTAPALAGNNVAAAARLDKIKIKDRTGATLIDASPDPRGKFRGNSIRAPNIMLVKYLGERKLSELF